MHTNQHARQRGAGPLRLTFSLRALLLITTLCACLSFVMTALGPAGSIMLVMALAIVAAHVLGNALGCKLRDQAPENDPDAGSRFSQSSIFTRSVATALDVAHAVGPRGHLHVCKAPGGAIHVAATVGALAGALLGAAGLTAAIPRTLTLAGLSLGVGSSAVLGAFAGFLASSFVTVARTAWREAELAGPSQKFVPRSADSPLDQRS